MRRQHVMAISVPVENPLPNLALPGTRPMYQPPPTIFGGLVEWDVDAWSETEFKRMQQIVEGCAQKGMDMEKLVVAIYEAMKKAVPKYRFRVMLGTFALEYDPAKDGPA